MQITIGTTKKRVNSTSQVFEDINHLNVTLKNPTSIHDPVFIVENLPHGKMYNFCQYGNYYYWIDDVIYLTNELTQVNCHLDPLATFKTRIYDVNALVVYGDNAHRNPYKDDIRFGSDFKLSRATGVGVDSVDLGFTTDNNAWSVLMTCQACSSFSYDYVYTAAMDLNTFRAILKGFSGVVYSDITSWSTTDIIDIVKNYCERLLTGGQQALDNIRAVVAVPIPIATLAANSRGSATQFALGPYIYNLDAGHVVYAMNDNAVITGNDVLSLGRPIVNGAYYWLNSPKYCSLKLTHPCGYQEINDPSLLDKNQLYVWYSVGLCSGEYYIRVTSENSKDSDTIALISGCVGIDMFKKVPNSNASMDSNAHNTIDNLVLGSFGYQFNAGSMSPARMGKDINIGYAGINLLTAGKTCFLDSEYYYPAIFTGGQSTDYVSYCSEYGYPIGEYLRVGDISGFCQCANANIGNIEGATESDKININTYLNTGIFIEF